MMAGACFAIAALLIGCGGAGVAVGCLLGLMGRGR
jgi:hypothetical protein